MSKISNLTQAHIAAGLNWMSSMSHVDRWNLTDKEVAILLGGIDVESYRLMQRQASNGDLISMTSDICERISLLLGIWKSLQLMAPINCSEFALAGFNTSNSSPLLGGKSIKDYLIESRTIEAFYLVKQYLDYGR